MSSPDLIEADQCGDVALPVNPFVSNRYHFGMLLGVADLEAEQAYHRGKSWLHHAWLHGTGAVWGLRVEIRADHGEVVVQPGLAVDAHGRELSVTDPMCVDLVRWFDERRPDDLEVTDEADGGVSFDLYVELCHDSCSDRPVPSIAQPCDGANRDTAYSRSVERGLPRLVAGPVPDDPPPSHLRLRQLFGQVPVTDAEVTDALDEIAAADPADQAATTLGWFRRLAAEDSMDLAPADDAPPWSPAAGDGGVPLAQLRVHLSAERTAVVVDSTVDNRVRATHVPTRTLQELLCHGSATS